MKVRKVSILQEDSEQIYCFQLGQIECRHNISQEEAHNNFSDEFTSELSIDLLLVVQFWNSTWQIFFLWSTAFSVTAKVTTYQGMVAT